MTFSSSIIDLIHSLIIYIASIWLKIFKFIFSPFFRLLKLLLNDVYMFIKPVTDQIMDFFVDFGDMLNETDNGWFKCGISCCCFVPFCTISTSLIYFFLYYRFVTMSSVINEPLYFQFQNENPFAIVDSNIYSYNQYNFDVSFKIPNSEWNQNIGMIMTNLNISLISNTNPIETNLIFKESRPLLPLYQSFLVKYSSTIVSIFPLIFGLWREESFLSIELASNWSPIENKNNLNYNQCNEIDECNSNQFEINQFIPIRIEIELNKPLQIYEAQLKVLPELNGFSYLWFHFFYSTSLIVILSLITCQGGCFAVLWATAARIAIVRRRNGKKHVFRREKSDFEKKIEKEESFSSYIPRSQRQTVKQELNGEKQSNQLNFSSKQTFEKKNNNSSSTSSSIENSNNILRRRNVAKTADIDNNNDELLLSDNEAKIGSA